MASKLPSDAFEYYVGLGAERSYEAVAFRYGVSKRTVTKRARNEHWQARIEEIERKARARSDERALESLEAMNRRHLETLKVIQGKALQTLKEMPLATAAEATRALLLAIRQERIIRGEPSERTELSIENLIRREYERWTREEEADGEDEEA